MSILRRSYRFWDCSVLGCSHSAAVDIGNCEHCKQHFCADHAESGFHTCPIIPLSDEAWNAAQTTELEFLRTTVDPGNLLRRASRLHHGVPCDLDQTDPLGRSRMGGMHIHLRILFDDGTVWLARIPRCNFTSFSDDLSNAILLSECATLKWLETVHVPAPRLHAYGLRNDPKNDVGVAFMLIDEIQGRQLSQLSPSALRLSKTIEVGLIAGDRTGTLAPIGPFDSGIEYYAAWAREYLRMIVDGQVFARYPVNAYLVFKYFEQLAIEGKCNDFEMELDHGNFFLKHMDDKGDHIFVDEDYNITGIIDWSFARIVPAYEAFGPSLVTANMDHIFGGVEGLRDNDRMFATALQAKNKGIGRYSRSPDKVRRLIFGLGMGMDLSWDEALNLFRGILATFGDSELVKWETWREDALKKWASDANLAYLLEKSRKKDQDVART